MPQVLIVDDEPEILEIIQEALQSRGVQVKAALDDQEALALLEQEAREMAVLVTDINLGVGVTGFDLARKAREINPSLKVVYITGNPEPVKRYGVDGALLIEKPFAPDEFAETVVALVQPRNENVDAAG